MSPRSLKSRRAFLRGTTISLASLAALPAVRLGALLGAGEDSAPSARIRIGLIGCGSLGVNYHLRTYLPMDGVRLAAVCDVDRSRRERAAGIVAKHYRGGERPGCYNDYRELLDRKDIDAVIIATPDHWHALQTIHACAAGKDVHCEKPLSLTVAEGRAMVQAARRHARIVQTGSESRSKPKVRLACELVRSGRIGKLARVDAGLGRNPVCKWAPSAPCPAGLDWDFWLGPARRVPYHEKRCHYTFRWFRDYSGGKLTDWGTHLNDIAQWGMGTETTGPVKVEATARYAPGNMYEFPPEFKVTCTYENGVELVSTSDAPHVTFHGTAGKITIRRAQLESDPPGIAEKPLGPDDVHLVESSDHDRNWLECIRSRRRPVADVEIGHRSATVCHLGVLAVELQRPLQWDPEFEEFEGDEEANRCLSRPMRSPWHL